MDILKEELAFFDERKSELLKTHPGQFALIKGRQLVGILPTREQAYAEGVKRFRQESFLLKQILEHDIVEQVPLLAHSIPRADI